MNRYSEPGVPTGIVEDLEPFEASYKYLFVVRESSPKPQMLKSMLNQTLRRFRDLPEVQRAMDRGLDPWTAPHHFGGVAFRGRGSKGVLYAEGNCAFLIYGGSAALQSRESAHGDRADNDFARHVASVIIQCRPQLIVLNEVTRLFRKQRVSFVVEDAMQSVGAHLLVSGQELDMRTSKSRNTLRQLIAGSESERESTLDRTINGVVERAKEGIWPRSRAQLPLGWKLGRGKVVMLDDDAVAGVREWIRIAAIPGLPPNQRARLWADAGMTTLGTAVRRGDTLNEESAAPVDEVKNPHEVVRRVLALLSVWRSGIYIVRQSTPLDYLEEVAGIPVVRDGASERGHVDVPMSLPLPEDGFADDLVFEAARANLSGPAERGARAHSTKQNALSYFRDWEVDGMPRRLMRRGIRTRLVEQVQPHSESLRNGNWSILATFDSRTFVNSLVTECAAALARGVRARHLEGRLTYADYEETHRQRSHMSIRRLTAEVRDLTAEISGLTRELNRLNDDDPAKDEVRRVIRELSGAKRQKTQLLQGAKTHGAPIESGDSAELEPVIRALAVIAECDQLVDRTVATATTSVLTGLRVEICQPGTVTWTVTLVVPTATGVLLLGGITGTIDSIGTETGNDGVRKKLGQPSLRREQALRALLCEGRSIDEIAADRGIQARSLHLSFPRDLRALGVSKLMVPALLNGSPPQLRAAVAHLLGLTDHQHGWNDEWLEAVRAAYISGPLDRWFKSWQPAVSDERQRLNRLLVDSGGILNLKEATVLHGFPASSLRTFASLSGSHPATVSILDDRIGRGSGVLRLRVCQCCGSPLSLILRVPESAVFSSALLCENCRTLGVKGSPVFPDFYFDFLSRSEDDQSNSQPEQTDGNNE